MVDEILALGCDDGRRGQITSRILTILISPALDSPRQIELLNYLNNPASPASLTPIPSAVVSMEVDSLAPPAPAKALEKLAIVAEQPLASALPEGEVYMSLLVAIYLLDHKEYVQVRSSRTLSLVSRDSLTRRCNLINRARL